MRIGKSWHKASPQDETKVWAFVVWPVAATKYLTIPFTILAIFDNICRTRPISLIQMWFNLIIRQCCNCWNMIMIMTMMSSKYDDTTLLEETLKPSRSNKIVSTYGNFSKMSEILLLNLKCLDMNFERSPYTLLLWNNKNDAPNFVPTIPNKLDCYYYFLTMFCLSFHCQFT